MFFKNLTKLFCTTKHATISAHKYMKSVTETALLYRPEKTINLNTDQNLRDRVVQAFFDSSKARISVVQAAERLKDVSTISTPAHSYYQINLPFHDNHIMRRKMSQFSSPSIRVGRLLQLMDYIASNVAFRYCIPDTGKQFDIDALDFIVVTAAVDEIEFYYPIRIDTDCLLSGYVSYVGKSSIEVHIDVLQQFEGKDRLACSANFVMVARSKKNGKAYEVPRLKFDQENQFFKIINELGEQRQVTRKNQSKRNLQITPPTYEESVIVHKLNQTLKQNQVNYRSLSSTILKNTMLMHVQDKNLSGKIFGGLILRIGYQLGWLCATKFLVNSLPTLSLVDEVQFLAPVQVGTSIQLQAYVGYVTDRFLHVIVTCFNSQLSGKRVQTNLLHITFEHSEGNSVKKVYPQSLSQSYSYIESLRRVKKLTHIEV